MMEPRALFSAMTEPNTKWERCESVERPVSSKGSNESQVCLQGSLLVGVKRNPEREPDVPALRPILGSEFVVTLEIHVPRAVADLAEMAGLWSDRRDLRLEITEACARSAIAGELIVDIADDAHVPVGGGERNWEAAPSR
jgi:hypothetical protein